LRTGCSGREEVTGGWRKLYSEELYNFDSSLNIIRVNKSRNMRWEDEKWVKFCEENHRDIVIDGRMILKCLINNSVRMWTGFICLRIKTSFKLL
jgi:hypothetical protein